MIIPSNLIFINAVPVDKYFLWQEEVMITNFQKHGIDNIHVLVWYPESRKAELKEWDKLKLKYPRVLFFYYRDFGVNLSLYIPQLRPHILKQHFKAYKEFLKDKTFFYHDSDIIFNYLPDFEKLLKDDICWQSNTSSYLDYNYLKRKEEQGELPEGTIINKMSEIGNVPVEVIKSYVDNTGGAQYILKGIDDGFWEDVERQVVEIRLAFYYLIEGSVNKKYFKSENEGLQSWCADMWALNFALWSRGIRTEVTPDLDFAWATNDYQTYLQKPIYHNAGATGTQPGVFHKGKWINESPLHIKHYIDPNSASYAYVKAMEEVKE